VLIAVESISTNQDLISECQARLKQMREDLLNRIRGARLEVTAHDKMAGDEADQTVAQISEDNFLINQERARKQLLEIEQALARIQKGVFGICEETLEPIEPHRLLAIPYTRLSIEGAEIREALERKYAKY
jgi:DnaK suppressor protein